MGLLLVMRWVSSVKLNPTLKERMFQMNLMVFKRHFALNSLIVRTLSILLNDVECLFTLH